MKKLCKVLIRRCLLSFTDAVSLITEQQVDIYSVEIWLPRGVPFTKYTAIYITGCQMKCPQNYSDNMSRMIAKACH